MSDLGNLIGNISRELNIVKGINETDELWMSRVIYSAIGESGLLSLWDRNDDEEPVTIIHFKSRIREMYFAYMDLFQESNSAFTHDVDSLSEEMYELYKKGGYIYHSPNRMLPCTNCKINSRGIVFVRGIMPSEKREISGLGQFQRIENGSGDVDGILKMFHVNKKPLIECYDSLVAKANWQQIIVASSTEYLRVVPPFSRGYWTNSPLSDGSISLLRMGDPGGKQYYLYKCEAGIISGSQLPVWMVEGTNYRKVANAILANRHVLPCIEAHKEGDSVSIKFNYLPANDVHDFIKLYSWPKSFYDVPCNFNRRMNADVWNAIKEVILYLGYTVEG